MISASSYFSRVDGMHGRGWEHVMLLKSFMPYIQGINIRAITACPSFASFSSPSFASQSSPFLLPSHLLGGCCCILVCASGSHNTIVFNFRPRTVIAHRVPTPTHHPALTVNQPRSPWLRYPLPGCTWVICLGMVSISLLRNYLR